MWYGKLLGTIFGLIMLGPIGGLLGLFIGHKFDEASSRSFFRYNQSSLRESQKSFFNITFSVMGHIAKSDGRVSEQEIKSARAVMDRLHLNADQVRQAIHCFNEGKKPSFDLARAMDNLTKACREQRTLFQMFLDIQFQAAKADGQITSQKKAILQYICKRLGFAPAFSWEYANIFGQNQQQTHHRRRTQPHSDLYDAYRILDVKPTSTESEIRKAYRRLMSQNHPDKLISKGLPESMIKLANEKTQRIKKAYEEIKKIRGFK